MKNENYRIDWIMFIGSLLLLYIVYGFKIIRLIELLLQWTFAVFGFKLLIEYGLMKNVEKALKDIFKN